MTQIRNRTPFTIVVNSKEFIDFASPGATISVPDDVARAWISKPMPAAFIARGEIIVSGLEPAKTEPVAASEPAPAKPIHWRKMMKLIAETDDLDDLAEAHASETRPKVLEAIEARMIELRGA